VTETLIRDGTIADAQALAVFAARVFADAFGADTRPDDLQRHLASAYGPVQQAGELADPDVTTLLATHGGQLVAYAQLRRNAQPPPCVTHATPVQLQRFYLVPALHGSGLATRLMHQARLVARELGGGHLWLTCWERNARALAFYRKAGFVAAGVTHFAVGSDRQVDRVLVRALDSV
jgi:diamine N-acetyltransferase